MSGVTAPVHITTAVSLGFPVCADIWEASPRPYPSHSIHAAIGVAGVSSDSNWYKKSGAKSAPLGQATVRESGST